MKDIALDVETHLIQDGMKAPRLVCGTFCEEAVEPRPTLHLREQFLDRLGMHLADRDVRLGGHHVFFDLGVSCAERPELIAPIFKAFKEDRIWDTKITQMIIDNARGELKFEWDEELEEYKKTRYGLGDLIRRRYKIFVGKKDGEEGAYWRLRFANLDGKPLSAWPPEAKKYVLDDAVWPSRIRHGQVAETQPEGVPGEPLQIQAAWALNLMGTWGVRTEEAAVDQFERAIETEYHKHVVDAQEHGFVRKDGTRDMKKIKAAVYDYYTKMGLPVPLTEAGQVGTDRKTLTTTKHPGLVAVANVVRSQKLLTTYVPVVRKGVEVPITTDYNPIIETFRVSGRAPNLTNLPRAGDVRGCFVSREGKVFIFCDYDAIEMFAWGQNQIDLFGRSVLADTLNAGLDPHIYLGAEIMGTTYKTMEERYNEGSALEAEVRQFSKIGNYGMAGGMSPPTFVEYAEAQGVKLDIGQAKMIHGGFRRAWAEAPDYFRYCSSLIGDNDLAPVVKFLRTDMLRGQVRYTAVCNGFFQHLVAIGAKQALWRVAQECYVGGSALYGCRPWLFAHDEIGIEAPDDPFLAHEAAFALKRAMVEEMKKWMPDMNVKASPVICRRWYKGAKPVYLEIGRNNQKIMVASKPSKDSSGKKIWISDMVN